MEISKLEKLHSIFFSKTFRTCIPLLLLKFFFFALKKEGHRICFWDISFVDKAFFARVLRAIKISTLQNRPLRMREGGRSADQ